MEKLSYNWWLLGLFAINYINIIHADCTFRVFNYSGYKLNVEAGFTNNQSKKFSISPSMSNSITIKDTNCTNTSPSGLGLGYIKIIGDKNNDSGWRYIPSSHIIRAIGSSTTGNTLVIGKTSNNNPIALYNNSSVTDDIFEVQVKPATFKDTKNSASN